MVDPSIISKLKAGNKTEYRVMYNATIRYVHAIVRRYVNNDSDHLDIIQEIYARVFLSIQSYDEKKGEFKPWIRKIALNQCLQHHRGLEKWAGKVVSMDDTDKLNNCEDSVDFWERYDSEVLLVLLQDMPAGYRQVFMLVVMDDCSHDEAAELLGISTATSRSQLLRAKRWLQKYVTPEKLMKYGFI